jgi:hypothetical protein
METILIIFSEKQSAVCLPKRKVAERKHLHRAKMNCYKGSFKTGCTSTYLPRVDLTWTFLALIHSISEEVTADLCESEPWCPDGTWDVI